MRRRDAEINTERERDVGRGREREGEIDRDIEGEEKIEKQEGRDTHTREIMDLSVSGKL